MHPAWPTHHHQQHSIEQAPRSQRQLPPWHDSIRLPPHSDTLQPPHETRHHSRQPSIPPAPPSENMTSTISPVAVADYACDAYGRHGELATPPSRFRRGVLLRRAHDDEAPAQSYSAMRSSSRRSRTAPALSSPVRPRALTSPQSHVSDPHTIRLPHHYHHYHHYHHIHQPHMLAPPAGPLLARHAAEPRGLPVQGQAAVLTGHQPPLESRAGATAIQRQPPRGPPASPPQRTDDGAQRGTDEAEASRQSAPVGGPMAPPCAQQTHAHHRPPPPLQRPFHSMSEPLTRPLTSQQPPLGPQPHPHALFPFASTVPPMFASAQAEQVVEEAEEEEEGEQLVPPQQGRPPPPTTHPSLGIGGSGSGSRSSVHRPVPLAVAPSSPSRSPGSAAAAGKGPAMPTPSPTARHHPLLLLSQPPQPRTGYGLPLSAPPSPSFGLWSESSVMTSSEASTSEVVRGLDVDPHVTLYLTGLPPSLHNGFRLSPYVPPEGLVSLRVKRVRDRDVGFAEYDSRAHAEAAKQWFYSVKVLRDLALAADSYGQPAQEAPHSASDPLSLGVALPLTYRDLQHCSSAPRQYAAELRACRLLEADWARGTPTYRPPRRAESLRPTSAATGWGSGDNAASASSFPSAHAPLPMSAPRAGEAVAVPPRNVSAHSGGRAPPPFPRAQGAGWRPPPPPLSTSTYRDLSASMSGEEVESPGQCGPIFSTNSEVGEGVGGTARSAPYMPPRRNVATDPAPTCTLFVKLRQNFTQYMPNLGTEAAPPQQGPRVAATMDPEKDWRYQLAKSVLNELFFEREFRGFRKYSNFMRPPFCGGCFVRFATPADAAACLLWMRSQREVRRLFHIDYARQDSKAPRGPPTQ